MKKFLLLAIAAIAFSSCQKNSDDKKQDFEQKIPETLTFSVPVQGEKVREEDINSMRTYFKKPQMAAIPGELINPSENISAEELAYKEEQLKKEDINAYHLLLDIRSGCQETPPKQENGGTGYFNNTAKANMPAEGDSWYSLFQYQMTGSSCPMNIDAGGRADAILEKVDIVKEQVSSPYGSYEKIKSATVGQNMSASGKVQFLMKNEKYAQLLGMRGVVVDSNMSGLSISKSKVGSSTSKSHVKFSVAGSYIALAGELPYKTEVEVLIQTADGKTSSTEMIASATFPVKNKTATLMVYSVIKDNVTIKKAAYLNGYPMTEAELEKVFGNQAPGLGKIENNQMLQALRSL